MILDIYQLLGWIGMILLILAYFLLSNKQLKFNSAIYHLLNFFGAAGIVISTLKTKSWPAMTLNLIWVIIALFFIYKIINVKPSYKELK
jgi:VIT1/CCC1 family predicted Fe2+/Mn2+ transporter